MNRAPIFLALASALAATPLAGSAAEFVPALPQAYEPIHVVETLGPCQGVDSVGFEGGRFVIATKSLVCGTPPPPAPIAIPLGRLPKGTYTVVFAPNGVIDNATQKILTVADGGWIRQGGQTSVPVMDVSGVWGLADHPATGLTVSMTNEGNLAALLFDYTAAREPTFFSLQGAAGATAHGGYWAGRVYRSTAGGTAGSDPVGGPVYTDDRTAYLTFRSPVSGELCIQVDSTQVPPPPVCYDLVRYPFH